MKNQTCYVAILPYYYHPDTQGRNAVDWLCGEYGYPEVFDSISEARETISKLDNEIYVLHSGEYSRPDYLVISQADYEYISTGRFHDAGNYTWDDATCVCGECDTCHQMMIEQNRKYVQANSL